MNATDELIYFIAGNTVFRYYVPSQTLDILCYAGEYPPITGGNAIWGRSNYEVEWQSYSPEYINLITEHGLNTQEFADALEAENNIDPLSPYCTITYNSLLNEYIRKALGSEYVYEKKYVEPLYLN